MEGAVNQRDADILDRVAGDGPGLHRFDHALLYPGDELVWDRPTFDAINELQVTSLRKGVDLDVAVAELTASAALLLVSPVSGSVSADGLAIGNVRGLERHLDTKA